MAVAAPSYSPSWAAAPALYRGAAGRDVWKGADMRLTAELGRRGRKAEHAALRVQLKLGGEPRGPDPETMPRGTRLGGNRRRHGGARHAHRCQLISSLLPGCVPSLTDVNADTPGPGVEQVSRALRSSQRRPRDPRERQRFKPLDDELDLMLKPWREQPYTSRGHVPAPYHEPARERRARAAAWLIDPIDDAKAKDREALDRGVQLDRDAVSASSRDHRTPSIRSRRSDGSQSARLPERSDGSPRAGGSQIARAPKRMDGSHSAREELLQPQQQTATIHASVDSSPASTAAGSSFRAAPPVALPRPPPGPAPAPAHKRSGRMPLSPIIEFRLLPTMPGPRPPRQPKSQPEPQPEGRESLSLNGQVSTVIG